MQAVAGVDVHKRVLVITALVEDAEGKEKKHVLKCSTMTEDLRQCARKLVELGVRHTAMESTGIYWKPVYHIWRSEGLLMTLGNAQHMKCVPGRKTDVTDSEWIARLHKNGLIRPSYVPEQEFQQLRALTRHRTYLVSDLTRIKNRVQKVLEDANVKLASILSSVFGVSGMAVLRAIAEGERDTVRLARLITTNVKASAEEIHQSLSHCLTDVHAFEIKEYLKRYDNGQESLASLQREIDRRTQKYEPLLKRIDEIPGIDRVSAQVVLAEMTDNMDSFREDRHLAAWSGVAPGNYQSAGKRKKTRIRHGNPNLKRVLVQAARSASRKKGSYYEAKHRRLVFQLGSRLKATVAIANRICRALYHLIKNPNERFKDLGWLRVENADRAIRRKIGQLRAMGLTVQYDGGSSIQIAAN